jgi:hypothetical protein
MKPAPTFDLVRSDADIKRIADLMKPIAKRHYVTEKPTYSSSPEEATARALPIMGEIAAAGLTRWLLFPFPGAATLITVVLSIDAYEDKPVWHISMSMAPREGNEPLRVPDDLARRILTVFFEHPVPKVSDLEGPREGAFKNVRHFRTPYRAD